MGCRNLPEALWSNLEAYEGLAQHEDPPERPLICTERSCDKERSTETHRLGDQDAFELISDVHPFLRVVLASLVTAGNKHLLRPLLLKIGRLAKSF